MLLQRFLKSKVNVYRYMRCAGFILANEFLIFVKAKEILSNKKQVEPILVLLTFATVNK